MKKKKTHKKKHIFKILIILFISIISIGGFYYYDINKQEKEIINIFTNIENESVSINKYILYGTHLNLEGTLDKNIKDVSSVYLVLKSIDGKEKEYKISYSINETLKFSTSKLINTGINLEGISSNNYYMFLKINYIDNKNEYYTLENKTKYKEISYYTITKNKSNNKIIIDFKQKNLKNKTINYLSLTSHKTKLPSEVYDIVIDAGHGGDDSGAVSGNYSESKFNLKNAIALKKALENEGYKVKMTRENDTNISSYGKNGRAGIAQTVKAKFIFSLHLNSNDYPVKQGGVEIYAPNNTDLTLATDLANNIVNYTKTNYSINYNYKIKNGVYVRNFLLTDIIESKKEAKENGYKPYNISTSTPYYYMLRETGGIATYAYVDGRNTKYDPNPYYNSNIGIESYILELGYIIDDNDVYNIINNQDKYIEAISTSISNYINKNQN